MKSNSLFKTNIVIGFVLIIGFMLTAFFGYQANYQSSLNTIEHVSTLTSEGIYYQLTSMFTRPVNISLTMAHDSFLKDHLEKEQEQFTEQSYIETLREYLNVYKEKYSFDSVFLVSTESGRYYSYRGLDRVITKESRENEWYYDLLYSRDEYALNVDNDEVEGASNEITVFVNCKITDEHNKTIGIVGVGIRLQHLKELLGEYEKKYNNIIIIDQENKGPGFARNIGMKRASGKYIYFLDSDDYIELNAMEICFKECEINKLDFITFDSNVLYEDGYSSSDLREIDRSNILDSKICSGKILFNKMMETHGMYYESCLNFFYKDFLNKFKIKYRDNLIYEDVIKTVNSYICANRVKYVDKKLFNRRVRKK